MNHVDPRALRDMIVQSAKEAELLPGLFVRVGDCIIELRTSSRRLSELLAGYYRAILTGSVDTPDIRITAIEAEPWIGSARWKTRPLEAGKTKIKEEYLDVAGGRLVRKCSTGLLFFFDGRRHIALGPCADYFNQVASFIASRHIQWMLDRGCLPCHSAGVSLKGLGLAISGLSGRGKSTLALHAMQRGLDFVSNDRVLIRAESAGTMMHGVPKMPRVNPGTLLSIPSLKHLLDEEHRKTYEETSMEDLWITEHKHDVLIDDCFGPGRLASSAKMEGILVLTWDRSTSPMSFEEVDLAERPDLLEAIVKPPGTFFLKDSQRSYSFEHADYSKALEGVTVLEVRGGVDFARAAEECAHFLEQRVASRLGGQ